MNIYFGITKKVVVAMSIVVLSIMLLIATYTYSQSEKLMRFQIERELSAEIESIENEVAAFFKQKGEVVRQLSIIPVVKQIAKGNETRTSILENPNYDWLQQALTETQESNDNINLLWFVNLEHSYIIASDGQISDSSYNVKERPWYPNAQQMEGPSYSSPYIDFATKKWTVSITNPVILENERMAYIGVDVHLDDLSMILHRYEKNDHYIILFSDDDQVLYDKHDMWGSLKQGSLEEEKVLRLGSSKDIYYTDIRQVSDLGWKIAIYVPEEVFLEPLIKYQSSLILFWIAALIILLTILSLVLRHLLKDIPFITKQLKKMEHGYFNINMGMTRNDEVGEIARAVDQMAEKIQIQMKEMNDQAHFDSLTKLPNRHSIEGTLDEWIRFIGKDEKIMAVAFLDLDHFKQINDTKGHAHGDELLIQVGKRIKNLLPMDSFFGRFGGDEFIILLFSESGCIDKIQLDLRLVHDSFSKEFNLFGDKVYMTTSMGIAYYPEDALTKLELLANADTALYEAKAAGRNLTYFFNKEMKEAFEKSFTLQRDLRAALDNNEFVLHYQPQVDTLSGRTTGVEALIRWIHPHQGMISPAEFIPMAESTGQICEIGNWVIDTGLQAIKRIIQENPSIQRIAINVSAIQLREFDFVQNLKNALESHDVPPNLLEIEITESIIIVNEEEALQKIKELKALGIQIALDDFGTGYSSLNYLHMMAIDKVKIDRSFIQQLKDDTNVASIIKTIIELGHTLGFEVVAEGVEDEVELQLLREMNIDCIQGFYYSRPLNETSLNLFLNSIKY